MRATKPWKHMLMATAALAALTLGGCLPLGETEEPDGWGEVEEGRLEELRQHAWFNASPGEQGHSPYRFDRPAVGGQVPAEAEAPWADAAEQVAAAQGAGWTPVFVSCSAPEGRVHVDLVRTLSDGSPATARIVAGPQVPDTGHEVDVHMVGLHHLDGDWVNTPPSTPSADFDAGTCLSEPGQAYEPRWSGTPVMFDLQGSSPPTH